MGDHLAPVPLEPTHHLHSFTCASAEQTDWLHRFAQQSHRAGSTKVFVVTESGSDDVVAYYAWCMASLSIDGAPFRSRKGAGRYPQPVALLARLGVDRAHEGRRLGSALLLDVITRAVALSDEIGSCALLIHVESDEARAWYAHVLPDLEQSPTDPLHLTLLMKDARAALT